MKVDRGWIAQRVGLAHGEVRLATNHDAWRQVAKHLCDCIKSAADDSVIAVEHIGSTAVDEMVAKPIVDIAVGLRDANDIEAMRGVVERLGFAYRDGVGDGQVFILDDAGRRLVNLHLVTHDDAQWRDWIALRDLLRDDRTARFRYAAVKERAARVHQHDRDAYTASKTAVIRDLLGQPIE